MKLTSKQSFLLHAIANGERCSFHPYMGRFNPRAYYSCHSVGACTPSAKALLSRGLVQRAGQEKYSESHILVLTDAGRDAAEMPPKDSK